MSAFVVAETERDVDLNSDLADLVAAYSDPKMLPSPEWFSRLHLQRARKSVRCLSERTRLAKRIMDIVISSTALVLLAPVMLCVALAVKLTSPGPIIFRQVRTGLNLRRSTPKRNGTPVAKRDQDLLPFDHNQPTGDRRQQPGYGMPFVLYKFRTMRVDAEKNGAQFATKGDPRVPPIGSFLRKTRLDELPQLWNVLRGEMTLVGPRPERPVFIEALSKEIPNYLDRLGLKPGLTGLAQIINGYDNNIESFRRKVALDLLYLQNCCIWNDIKILIRTVGVVLTGKGAL